MWKCVQNTLAYRCYINTCKKWMWLLLYPYRLGTWILNYAYAQCKGPWMLSILSACPLIKVYSLINGQTITMNDNHGGASLKMMIMHLCLNANAFNKASWQALSQHPLQHSFLLESLTHLVYLSWTWTGLKLP